MTGYPIKYYFNLITKQIIQYDNNFFNYCIFIYVLEDFAMFLKHLGSVKIAEQDGFTSLIQFKEISKQL